MTEDGGDDTMTMNIAEVWAENARLAASYQDDADAICKALSVKWTPDNKYPTVALDAIAQLRAELNRARQDAQDQSDEVQELWLSPCEVEGLKRQLEQVEAQVAAIRQAVEWLWGFWDGNTLVARSSGYEEEIGAAWNKLLEASGAFSKSRKQPTEQRAKSTERELGHVRHALTAAGIPQTYNSGQPITTASRVVILRQRAEKNTDYIQWLHRILKDGGYILSTNEDGTPAIAISPMQELKREKAAAERRTEGLKRQLADARRVARLWFRRAREAEKYVDDCRFVLTGVRKALDECQVEGKYDAPAVMRIFWLKERAERAEARAVLVTPELAELLEKIASATKGWTSIGFFTTKDGEAARALAARIKEALDDNQT